MTAWMATAGMRPSVSASELAAFDHVHPDGLGLGAEMSGARAQYRSLRLAPISSSTLVASE